MIEIYTDGSCMNNPGVGGWAAIIMNDDSTVHLSGGEWSTTNNRMELTAAIKGLETLPAGIRATVHSDSEYLVKTMTRRWKRNANQDLWEQLDRLANDRQIEWEWVKGHSGNFGNEEADRLAGAAMRSINSNVSPGFDQITETGLTHLDSHGNAHMVDISTKVDTPRIAVARAIIKMKPTTLALVLHGQMPKGDVFTVARLAGNLWSQTYVGIDSFGASGAIEPCFSGIQIGCRPRDCDDYGLCQNNRQNRRGDGGPLPPLASAPWPFTICAKRQIQALSFRRFD